MLCQPPHLDVYLMSYSAYGGATTSCQTSQFLTFDAFVRHLVSLSFIYLNDIKIDVQQFN